MFRATQNPNEPNLPFAQSLSPTMFRDMQNPDTPNLPFSQPLSLASLSRPNPKHSYYYWIVNGDSIWFGKMTDSRRLWTESNAQNYRTMGYNVRKESETQYTASGKEIETGSTTTTTGSGLSRSEVEKIIESYHGDDISLLHSHAVDFGKQLSASKVERDRIEAKVNANKKEHQVMWDSISEKSDVSHVHLPTWPNGNGNGNGDCGLLDIPFHLKNFTGQVGTVAIVAAVGVGAYYLLKKRTRR